MTNYPNQLDDDVSLPRADDNITEIGDELINAIRSAIFALENEVGLGGSGTAGSIAARLGISLDSAGNIKPSALAGIGLVTLPITDAQISPTAGIQENKVALDYPTATLYNIINNLNTNLDTSLNFIINHGSKLEPHLAGDIYRHVLNQIDIDSSESNYFLNKSGLLRNNTNLYTLFNDINNDLVSHEKADSTSFSGLNPTTQGGTVPPTNYAHVASGLYLNTDTFAFIPQTATDLQQFAQFIDNSNIFILGTRIQTLYQNGISRSSRAAILSDASLGQLIVPITNVTTYLLNSGSNAPVDSIDYGDDLIQFQPSTSALSTNLFTSQFSTVTAGDIVTVNYGNVVTTFIVREVKIDLSGITPIYTIRIDGKNLLSLTNATAQINKPLFNTDKYGVLALAQAQPPTPVNSSLSSLIIGNPRGAEVLGIGFNPDLLDSNHYNLYLVLYPNGNPANQTYAMPAIDITGNKGITPGNYTLESIVASANAAFRTPGFNCRFIAYSYQGNFGIMLADSYGGASFSVISGVVGSNGLYDYNLTTTIYPYNVVDVINGNDALGFGSAAANVASPPFSPTFANSAIAQTPTKIITPLMRKTFLVNGVERESLALEPNQVIDGYGDGYWPAFISAVQIIGSRVRVSYQVNNDLSASGLEIGKTIVVQSESGSGTQVDFGRFFIENIQFNSCNCDGYTSFATITVYDGVHGTGVTPYASSPSGTIVRLYFSKDSVSFNAQNVSDDSASNVYKRYMEVLIDEDGYTFTQERGRLNVSGSTKVVNNISLYTSSSLQNIHISKISPKLTGYLFGNITSGFVTKITLEILSYNQATGIYDGYLCYYDGTVSKNFGPLTTGKKGQPVRFYDNTYIDYIDFIFNINDAVVTANSVQYLDIQLFPSLSLDDEVMLIGTVEVNDTTTTLDCLQDSREFGNISEEQLSTSVLDYISSSTRLLQENGIIMGFDVVQIPNTSSPYTNLVSVNGGVAIVNGKIIQINPATIAVPIVNEYVNGSLINQVNWFLCVNSDYELELIASTDFDPNGSFASIYNNSSLDNNRLFNVVNPNVSLTSSYTVRGDYFSDLILNQKDVAVIGILNTTVTSVSGVYYITTCSYSDARRYIGSGNGGLSDPFILSQNGSFRSFNSVNAWLIQLNNYVSATSQNKISVSNKVIVRGSLNVTSNIELNYNYGTVNFVGDESLINVTVAIAFTLGNNIHFDNLRINYNYDPVISGDTTYVAPVSGAGQLINSQKGLFYCNVQNNKNISITNCNITWQPVKEPLTVGGPVSTVVNRYPYICFNYSTPAQKLSNIIISNNYFNSNLSATTLPVFAGIETDDNLAGIIFTDGYQLNTPSYGYFSKLINCKISSNVFDKNQIIAITSQISGTNLATASIAGNFTITSAINTINTIISDNTCGVISAFNAIDFSTGYEFNSNQISNNRNYGLIISNNTSMYICSLDGTGNQIQNGVGTINVNTGNSIIENNTCNWINVLRKNTLSNIPFTTTIIKNNLISSNNVSFLENYNIASYESIAILVDSSPLVGFGVTNYYTEAIIEGNTIIQGTFSDSTVAQYNIGISLTHNGKIINNIISGMLSTGFGITAGSSDFTIAGNKIYRNSQAIGLYIEGIAVGSSGVGSIIDNYLDSPYIDVANTNSAVISSNANVIVERNTNQTSYVAIPLWSYNALILPDAGLSSVFTFDGNTAPLNNINAPLSIKLSGILPNGVKIAYVTLGMYDTTIISNSGSSISLEIQKHITNTVITPTTTPTGYSTNNTYGGTFRTSIVDVSAVDGGQQNTVAFTFDPPSSNISLDSTVSGNGLSDIIARTIYLNIDMSASTTQMYTGKGYESTLLVNFDNVKTSSTSSILIFSPVVVKYIWL